MQRLGALLLEHEAIAAAAVVAAQATLGSEGFRQRDARFFIELFSNWLEATTGTSSLELHNTQVQRYLEELVEVGWAKRPRRKPPRYRLTPDGLLGLMARLVRRTNLKRLDEFFLVYHLVHAYGGRLRDLVQQVGALGSASLTVDLNELLDHRRLVAREQALVARELARLSVRIDESRKTSELTRELLGQGLPLAEVIARVEARYPYELNSRKPLRELFSELPAPFRQVELEINAEERAIGLWEPTHELLLAYERILARLAEKDLSARAL